MFTKGANMKGKILIHPAVAADYKAAQALAERHDMQVTLAGQLAMLEPVTTPVATTHIPAPSSWGRRAHHTTRTTTGGDAA
jgi:hypothetical protein